MEFNGFKINYSSKEVTPHGGLILMQELMNKCGIKEKMEKIGMPESTSPNSFKAIDVVMSFFVSVWCGANNLLQIEHIRYDEALKKIFSLKKIPSHVTIGRFFKKFSWKKNNEFFPEIQQWWFEKIQMDRITLDFDSTVITRYGQQEGSKKGYNPHKKGRPSHHPIIAFVSELRMIANGWLRSGNTASSSSFEEFFEETIKILKGKTIGLIRADSGFYSKKIFELLEAKNIAYVIAVKLIKPIKVAIYETQNWTVLAKGIWISERMYQAQDWESPRRIIIIKQSRLMRPNSGGKIITLFGEEERFSDYRYSVYVTNQILPTEQIWNQYRGRADAENRIKELKYDFCIEGFVMKEFFATEAAFRMVIISYNLVSLFRQWILQSPVQHRLPNIRFNCFTVASWFTKQGNSRVLNMALKMKNRQWMDGLFAKYDQLSFPLAFQT